MTMELNGVQEALPLLTPSEWGQRTWYGRLVLVAMQPVSVLGWSVFALAIVLAEAIFWTIIALDVAVQRLGSWLPPVYKQGGGGR